LVHRICFDVKRRELVPIHTEDDLKTGQTSDAVRLYKRPNDRQLSSISDIVAGKDCKSDCTMDEAETVVKSKVDVCIPRSMFHACSFAGDVHIPTSST